MSGSGFDYQEFLTYRNNFVALAHDFDTWIVTFLIEQGMKFIKNVKLRTPVDTGALRMTWRPDGITRVGDELHYWFVNPMYYATFVEYGHAKPYKSGAAEGSADWVDGYFMMTVTLDEIERNMPKAYDRSFKLFLQGLGVT